MYSVKAAGSNDPSLVLLGRQKNPGSSSVKCCLAYFVQLSTLCLGSICKTLQQEHALTWPWNDLAIGYNKNICFIVISYSSVGLKHVVFGDLFLKLW